MMKKSKCAYCKENFTLLDFTNNQRTTINIKLENKTIQDIYLHDNCKEEYIKENNIFYCDECYKYDYKKGTKEEEINYFIDDDNFYHKKCFPDHYCYGCNKFVQENDHYVVSVYSMLCCDGFDTKEVVFHNECVKNFNNLCMKCNKAEQSRCMLCETSKAYGCLNGCQYGSGTWEYCDYCL